MRTPLALTSLTLFVLAAALPAPGCRGAGDPDRPGPAATAAAPAQVEFRLVVPQEHGAPFPVRGGGTLSLGPARTYAFAAFRRTVDDLGFPAIAFEVAASDADAFGDWTQDNIGRQIAIVIDGVVVTAPIVNDRLEGGGRIDGGPRGFPEAEFQDLIARLTPARR